MLLQVVRDLARLEHQAVPKVGEEEHEHDIHRDVPEAPVVEVGVDHVEPRRLEHQRRDREQSAREDDRHDARLVDLEREVMALAAIHLAAARQLGLLDGNPPLPFCDEDDRKHHDDEQEGEHHERLRLGETFLDLPDESGDRGRDVRDDTRHDQQADPVADPVLGDLLTEPHEEDRAGRNAEDRGALEPEGCIELRLDDIHPRLHLAAHDPDDDDQRLDHADRHGEQAGVLVDPLLAGSAFLLDLLERGHDLDEQAEDNRCADVRHDAEAEQRALIETTGADRVEEPDQAAERTEHLPLDLADGVHVDTRQGDVRADSVYEKQRDRQKDLAPQFRHSKDAVDRVQHDLFPWRTRSLRDMPAFIRIDRLDGSPARARPPVSS